MSSQPHPILDGPLNPDRVVPFLFAVSLLAAVCVGAGYTLLSGLDAHLKAQFELGQEAFHSVRTASVEQGR